MNYLDGTFNLFEGEESIYLQYKMALRQAKKIIYLENQHICDEKLMNELIKALKR